jgi:hypothetical protein
MRSASDGCECRDQVGRQRAAVFEFLIGLPVDAERLGHLHLGHPGSDPQPRSRSASLKASAGATARISITLSMMRVLERFELFSNNFNRLVEVVRFERVTPASRGAVLELNRGALPATNSTASRARMVSTRSRPHQRVQDHRTQPLRDQLIGLAHLSTMSRTWRAPNLRSSIRPAC